MQKPTQSLNAPKKGMTRKPSSEMDSMEYSFAMNANMESSTEEMFSLSNEQSNLLASRFKDGFKVIGKKNDINSNSTYFFLVNPATGVGEFGVIKNNQNNSDVQDIIQTCTDCTKYAELTTPLEDLTQTPLQIYETLLNDSCNKGFNFNVNFPIKKIVIKNEKCGTTVYFPNSTQNPPRYIQIDKLDQYVNSQNIVCGQPVGDFICFNTDLMRVFKKATIPEITPQTIELGGSLPEGTYEALVAYSDILGNELSQYYSITNPVSVFDENQTVREGLTEVSITTNFAIRFGVEGLDQAYTHYKVVIIQNVNNAETYVVEGIHAIDDNSVLYTTPNNKVFTTFAEITSIPASVTSLEGFTTSNNILFGYGIEAEKEWNLQPVVNFMGEFIEWQTSIANENFYKNGINSAIYRGYNRDETYPLSINFQTNTRFETAIFPFIGRKATELDLLQVSSISQDRLSIEANISNCGSTNRTKRWQYYNDATETGVCPNSEVNTNTVQEQVKKYSTVENVATIPGATFTVLDPDNYIDLTTLVEESMGSCSGYPFCSYLDISDYSGQNVVPPYADFCEAPTLLTDDEVLKVGTIAGETTTNIEKIFPVEYAKSTAPVSCNIYKLNSADALPIRDTNFEYLYMYQSGSVGSRVFGKVFERIFDFTNTACSYPDDVNYIIKPTDITTSYFHEYLGASSIVGLQTAKDTTVLPGGFTNKIHRGALWYKTDLKERTKVILEVSKQLDPSKDDDIAIGQNVRLSIYDNCSSSAPRHAEVVDLLQGTQIKIRIAGGNIFIKSNLSAEFNAGAFLGTAFLVAIDCPIDTTQGVIETDPVDPNQTLIPKYIVAPTDGCFSIKARDIEYSRIDVTYDSIVLNKAQTYVSTCNFEVPVVADCKALPYKRGAFGYTESTENYPDNAELYDSTNLIIRTGDFNNTELRTKFEEKFTDGYSTGKYDIKSEADFRCKPIRHFKFPDNKVAPFMSETPLPSGTQSVIFPLGITIDEEVITTFLDIAVINNLITQAQRDSITGYEIFRGDRLGNKSIEASGYLFDMRKYTEDEQEKLYSNYPFNDLGADKLNLDGNSQPIPHDSTGNYNFTFHSAETDFNKITIPSELKVEGYVFGKSNGVFVDVHDHPKWVILGRKAKKVASTLATIEVLAELALRVAESAEVYRMDFGFVESANVGGIILATLAAVLVSASELMKIGQHRLEWLKTFRDLGSPKNFAYKYSADGNYNYLQRLQTEGNLIRGVNVGLNLKSGNYKTTNNTTSQVLNINNLDREDSVFLSLGKDFPLVWANDYKNYDNGVANPNISSLTFASETGSNKEGRSGDIIKNIASPYVKLKNYLPSQYGTIGSISWVSTGFRGDLKNMNQTCKSIFGGDTYITRYFLKRKIPLFVTDAMGQASLQPFDYRQYTNIGTNPRFYCDYELGKNPGAAAVVFPDIDSEYNFDSVTGDSKMYVLPPSKFYLYYYGLPGILAETEINTNYQTAKKEPWNSFYPFAGDHADWTQENEVSIKRPNTYFYNRVYSKGTTKLSNKLLPVNYNKLDWNCRYDSPNGVMYSNPDNDENGFSDPWLVFKPLNFYQFPTSYGKLHSLEGIENDKVLARFEHTVAVYNAIDLKVDNITPQTDKSGTGGVFAQRPDTFFETQLGFGGTQTAENISCEFGHFHVDAKRGQVIQIDNGGKGVKEISGYEQGLRNWFKEHLPFKILKSNIKGLNTDNAYNGVGITMGWDSRFNRVFLTKKDYIPKQDCVKYNDEIGFYTDCGAGSLTCPEGYTLNIETQMCERAYITPELCPPGYTYNVELQTCTLITLTPAECSCTVDVIATPPARTITTGENTSISLTSTTVGATFTWTVVQTGVTGGSVGSGNTISQVLINIGSIDQTATYTITPHFGDCIGTPINVVITVTPSEINFDVVSTDWGSLTTPSAWQSYFISQGASSAVITNFTLVSGRVRFKIITDLTTSLNLSSKNITDVYQIGIALTGILSLANNQIVNFNPTTTLNNGIKFLFLDHNQIVNFNPTISLPTSLKILGLGNNQIVTFDTTIALPANLQSLLLDYNLIVTFDPTTALPANLDGLVLSNNNIVTFNPTIPLPVNLDKLYISYNNIVTFNPTIPLPIGLGELGLDSNQIANFNPTNSTLSSLIKLTLGSNLITTSSWNTNTAWISAVPNGGQLFATSNTNPVAGTTTYASLSAKSWTIYS